MILNRDQQYTKVFEHTYNTNLSVEESDALACKIRDASSCDNIILLTGIGKWVGAITPQLIKEVMYIGGPDLTRLKSIDM